MSMYALWAWLVDTAAWTGSRKCRAVRESRFWRWFASYYPVALVKTADLPPDHHYLFACHPHGILPIGPFTAFGTEALDFRAAFPGIDCFLLGLNLVTYLPLARELSLACGVLRVDKEVCDAMLSSSVAGRSVAIVVGGAQEALDCKPGDLALTILRRKGFVRVALRNGAALVPVISFGETDLWDQVANTTLRRVQEWLCHHLTFSLPLIKGRGVFQYSYGFLPHRRPVTVVVGAPLPCPRVPDPSQEQVDEYHALYLVRLRELFDAHKARYIDRPDAALILT